MRTPRILIAGIGNIFLGDDAFGVEVVRRLAGHRLPEGVKVVDFGIRSFDLAYALCDGYDAIILVDAVPRGEPPGTLCVIEPEIPAPAGGEAEELPAVATHNMNPATVLRLAAAMGGQVGRVFVVGCEPTPLKSEDDMEMELSPAVSEAADGAVELIESLVAGIRRCELLAAGEPTSEGRRAMSGLSPDVSDPIDDCSGMA